MQNATENQPLYLYHPTSCFDGKLQKIKKQDPPGYRRILKVIDRLLQRPGDADGRMHGVHHSRFKKYVGRGDYRLIYEWCAECRKTNRKLEHRCDKCEEVADNSVVFFDVYHKNEAVRPAC
ncbi:MAG: toxin [Desulfuromonadales bacterium]|nr:toxin [Desulfuromonadales bacterium]